MSIIFRIICGTLGLTALAGTVVLALKLLAMDHDARVYLAGYMAIGFIMLGAYLLFYAITGEWRPNLTGRDKPRQGAAGTDSGLRDR